MPRCLIGAGAVLAAVALAGCGGVQSPADGGGGAVPYPGGSWTAGDQGAFMKACSAVANATYCACALGDVMQQHANANGLHGSIASWGTAAGTGRQPFPDCANQ